MKIPPVFFLVQSRLYHYFPSVKGGFSLLWKVEIAVVLVVAISLYLSHIHPYLLLTSSSYSEQQQITQEAALSLVKRYTQGKTELEAWWKGHVISDRDLPKLLQDVNLASNNQMVSSVKVGETMEKEGYRQVSIQTTFQGDYVALMEWVNYLETLPYFLQVDLLDLKPHPREDLSTGGAGPVLIGQVNLIAILQPLPKEAKTEAK